jgi:inosine-uridine nucleoside N-ribohydrolase
VLGPLTIVAQALARDPSLARRVERVFVMGAGTTHGNLCCGAGDGIDHGQEFNFWADPAAAQEFMRQGLMYWWDSLNAAAAIRDRFVTYQRTRLTVVQSGVEAGRTVVDPHGARIRLGVAAVAHSFENHFLAMLNGRALRSKRRAARDSRRTVRAGG